LFFYAKKKPLSKAERREGDDQTFDLVASGGKLAWVAKV